VTFFFIVALACRSKTVHGTVLVVVEEAVEEDVGAVAVDPAVPAMGDTFGVGIAAEEPTPRLPISVESSGTPARMPVVVVDVDDEVGVDDDAMLVDPEPHIPVSPAVPSIPDVVDNPEVADTPEAMPDVAVVFDVVVAIVDAVAGGVAPLSVWPPPS
jgi:hypothetical protein